LPLCLCLSLSLSPYFIHDIEQLESENVLSQIVSALKDYSDCIGAGVVVFQCQPKRNLEKVRREKRGSEREKQERQRDGEREREAEGTGEEGRFLSSFFFLYLCRVHRSTLWYKQFRTHRTGREAISKRKRKEREEKAKRKRRENRERENA
jgi:hypothetical protein